MDSFDKKLWIVNTVLFFICVILVTIVGILEVGLVEGLKGGLVIFFVMGGAFCFFAIIAIMIGIALSEF